MPELKMFLVTNGRFSNILLQKHPGVWMCYTKFSFLLIFP